MLQLIHRKEGKKEMKQKLQKDLQLIADLGNEYKEKERCFGEPKASSLKVTPTGFKPVTF